MLWRGLPVKKSRGHLRRKNNGLTGARKVQSNTKTSIATRLEPYRRKHITLTCIARHTGWENISKNGMTTFRKRDKMFKRQCFFTTTISALSLECVNYACPFFCSQSVDCLFASTFRFSDLRRNLTAKRLFVASIAGGFLGAIQRVFPFFSKMNSHVCSMGLLLFFGSSVSRRSAFSQNGHITSLTNSTIAGFNASITKKRRWE